MLTRDEIIKSLRSCERRINDEAAAAEVVAQHFRPEYESCIHIKPTEATPILHKRALELYEYVIHNERLAHDLRKEAVLFHEVLLMVLNGDVPD